jgi:hypothetical protein
MLNPIAQLVAPWNALDSHRAKVQLAAQSPGFMPCVPCMPRNTADGHEIIHPIALPFQADSLISRELSGNLKKIGPVDPGHFV